MILLNSILVATDFSEPSHNALVYGRNLARTFGAKLHVLHVADAIATSAAQFYPEGSGDPEAKAEALALSQLQALLSVDTSGPTAIPAVRVSPSPAKAIVDYAKQRHVDIIIVATNGRSGVSRLLLGSVAEQVVRNAPCPVLVVRENEHEFVVPEPFTIATRI